MIDISDDNAANGVEVTQTLPTFPPPDLLHRVATFPIRLSKNVDKS